jgi:hypothetical protein
MEIGTIYSETEGLATAMPPTAEVTETAGVKTPCIILSIRQAVRVYQKAYRQQESEQYRASSTMHVQSMKRKFRGQVSLTHKRSGQRARRGGSRFAVTYFSPG